jgi:hypothetical protein
VEVDAELDIFFAGDDAADGAALESIRLISFCRNLQVKIQIQQLRFDAANPCILSVHI